MQHLPIHPTLTHPRTGEPIQAVGWSRRGPIWPILGGDGTDDGGQGDGAGQGDTGQQGAGVQGGQQPLADGDVASLPKWAQDALRDARSDAAKSRTTAKQQAADQARSQVVDQIAKALGLKDDDSKDPAKLAADVAAERTGRIAAEREATVLRLAMAGGVRGDKLVDSRSFMTGLKDTEPSDTKAIKAAIDEAVKDDATLRATAPPARSGGDSPPGPSSGLPSSDPRAADFAQIEADIRAGARRR